MRKNAKGEEIPPQNILFRVGQGHNKCYVVVYGYEGPSDYINPQLMSALDTQLDKKYIGNHWKNFDYIELLGEV